MTSNLIKHSKSLRKNSTKAEKILWSKIRASQLEGIKFRRQQPIENYIVDFVSFEKRLIIELDGGQHSTNKAKDRKRDALLVEKGFIVLRFWNNEVFENLDGVLGIINELPRSRAARYQNEFLSY